MLKQQLQKTEDELHNRYFEYTDTGIIVHYSGRPEETGNELSIDEFIRQAQIDAVKAFAEELQPFLYEYPGTDEEEIVYNRAVIMVKKAINNLLKDI